MKKINKIFLAILLCLSLFVSCSNEKVMGYSVLLWNIPEQKLQDGDIVPVYIKSNISHVYVIDNPDGEKIEVPLWQLTEPVSKRKSNQDAKIYSDYFHQYASVKLDGLPCRSEPENTSRQVYRLRKGEIIKILYKGEGQPVMAGRRELEGDWLRVLTDNGTEGWCFSYNLAIFETDESGKRIGGEEVVLEDVTDENFESITGKTWYPDYFKSLIESGNIDVNRLVSSYNFVIDTENNKVSLNNKEIHKSWNWEGFTKTGEKEYTFKNIPIVLTFRNSEYIVIRYTDESGKPEDLDFVLLNQNIDEIVNDEKNRRAVEFRTVVRHGPEFSSSSYGKLTFNENGTFRWTNFRLLVPSVIPSGSRSTGNVSVKYSLSNALKSSYTGVLTFRFEGNSEEVDFLYKIEDDAIRLESTTGAEKDGALFKRRSSSPMIIYFRK